MKKTLFFVLSFVFLLLPHTSITRAAPSLQATECHFFTETAGGQGGFSVCDDQSARFLTAFRGWGLQKVGYPISQRYLHDGFVTQAFQKAIMQWRPERQAVLLVNIFDDLHRAGLDESLLRVRQTPVQLPDGWDGVGLSFEQVVQKRQALLDRRPALRRAYFAAGDPLTFYGLPTSGVEDMGNHYAIRLQRAVLQEWKERVPWARAGEVTIANGGDIARELGALPAAALLPERSPAQESAPVPASVAPATPGRNHLGTEKVVLADYLPWYTPSTFDGSLTWDVPAAGPYHSDDANTIRRHLAEAGTACLDGFAVHWYGPEDGRTTSNFNQILQQSTGTSLRHAIVLQNNILPGANEARITRALRHLIDQWGNHPNYLRLGGRPVIIFTDMPRPWGSSAGAKAGWARIRAAVDPEHKTIWFAEGLSTTYNPLFDGLYAYRIDHRDYPKDWQKQPRRAAALRQLEREMAGSLPLGGLYFADTISPGFDDTRSVNRPDLRAPAPTFARDRREGTYYQETFDVTAQTGGDLLFVKSFNEWIEGTQIEPGRSYGEHYLKMTCQFANSYRSR